MADCSQYQTASVLAERFGVRLCPNSLKELGRHLASDKSFKVVRSQVKGCRAGLMKNGDQYALLLEDNACRSIFLHEMGHYVLQHHDRLEAGEITHIEAEVEATQWAMDHGADGEPLCAGLISYVGSKEKAEELLGVKAKNLNFLTEDRLADLSFQALWN